MKDISHQNQDDTTIQIFRILSGFDKDTLLYPEIEQDQDSAIYKTLCIMNAKYNNPKVRFMENFFTADYNACYDWDNIIFFKKNTKRDFWGIFIYGHSHIDMFLAELAHAYQRLRDWDSLAQKKLKADLAKVKTYQDLYSIPWTIENEAHYVIEPKLKKEFIDTYTSLCDSNDVKYLYNILAFNACFFARYDNIEEVQKYLEKILAIDGEVKDKWILKNIDWRSLGHKFEDQWETTKNEKYYKSAKICYLNSIKSGENYYNYLYQLCVKNWDIENAIKYNQLYGHRYWDGASENVAKFCLKCGKYQEALQIYKDLAKKWSKYAMSCLINLYDPESRDDDGKLYPCSNKEKMDFRKKRYIEKK